MKRRPPLPSYGATGTGTNKTNDATVTVAAGGSVQTAIDKAATGAVICVSAADYSSQTLNIAKPITVRATGPVPIRRAVVSGGATLEGFNVVGGAPGTPLDGITVSGNNNTVKNNLVKGRSIARGIFLSSGTGTVLDHNTITNINYYGIQTASGTSGAILSRNNIYDLYATVDTGLDTDAARIFGVGHMVRANYIHDIYQMQSTIAAKPHSDAFQNYQGTGLKAEGITYENNIVVRVTGMFMIFKNNQSTTRTMKNYVIRGNVVETYGWQVIILSGIEGATIENNTLFGATEGTPGPVITVEDNPDGGAVSSDIRIQNNVLVRGKSTNPGIGNKNGAAPDGVTLDVNNVIGLDTSLLTAHAAADVPPPHVTTPLVTSDFTDYYPRSQAYGTLVDRGSPLLTPDYTTDVAGKPRIVGAAVDIGAYETQVRS